GCRNGTPSAENVRKSSQDAEDLLQIIRPRYGERFYEGQEIIFEVRLNPGVDSVVLMASNGAIVGSFHPNRTLLCWRANAEKLGTKNFNFKIFAGKITTNRSLNLMLIDKNAPAQLQYRIVNVYPHATNAYTQGLIYDNGILYESDGQYGMSTLRKVQIESGKTLLQHLLPAKYFAEGIALYDNKIYQITWRENTCFVYDKETFKLIDQKSYDIAEGWGLASDGQYLYMTDGSNRVYTIEPETFSVVDMFEVVDNTGPVDHLNELEYVDGRLYANVYQTDDIVVIDLKQKRLMVRINLAHLLKPSDIQPNTDVLNGIAYNAQSKRFYITGKNWPKLFEIEIINTPKTK
ncbi:MAG: glutaminyl-peptide cyclotransferase, partial [Bacteroidales bacterium]